MAKEKKEKAPKAPKPEKAGGKGLNMDVNLDFLKDIGKKKSSSGLPSKKTMNLVVLEKGENSKVTNIVLISLLVVVLLVFGYFGVWKVYEEKKTAESDAEYAEDQLKEDQDMLDKYKEVFEYYDHDFTAFFSEEEASFVNRVEMMEMINRNLDEEHAQLQSLTIKGNTVSITLYGVSIEQTGKLYKSLDKEPMVKDGGVFMETANTNKDQNGTILPNGEQAMVATFAIELDPDYKEKLAKQEEEAANDNGDVDNGDVDNGDVEEGVQ